MLPTVSVPAFRLLVVSSGRFLCRISLSTFLLNLLDPLSHPNSKSFPLNSGSYIVLFPCLSFLIHPPAGDKLFDSLPADALTLNSPLFSIPPLQSLSHTPNLCCQHPTCLNLLTYPLSPNISSFSLFLQTFPPPALLLTVVLTSHPLPYTLCFPTPTPTIT